MGGSYQSRFGCSGVAGAACIPETSTYSPIQLLWYQSLLTLKKSKGSIGIGRSSGRANNNEKEFQDKTWWYHRASAYHPCIIHLNSTTPREISEMRWTHSALRTMSFWGCIVPPGQSKKVWIPCSKHRSNSNEINEEDNGKPVNHLVSGCLFSNKSNVAVEG